ncbi:glycine, alanine and asparagine-rich protein [Drosophila teissieri]|uniref:glycine, alanine and asparagine-rich protein n=1 Tax=Drosophila teissieri TaxID=7243 RepID=UPI001CB9F649|nr:glycine, alanine and asparagine-rich protein [Drosophila teissieri]
MRIDTQIMWLIIVLSSLLASATGNHYRTRRKPMQTEDSDLMSSFAGGSGGSGGGGGPVCDMSGEASNSPPKKPTRVHPSAKQRSSGIAVQAANEAKKANDDMATAVKVAADKIKNEYADKACAAAKAAEAVLSGKGQVLEQLEAEVREAEMVVQEENQELITAEANAQLASKAHHLGQQELKTLTISLKLAKDNLEVSDQVFAVWKQSLSDKSALLEAAQRRVTELMRQLSEARIDFEKTKKAALSAARAAQEAKQRIEHSDCGGGRSGRGRRAWREYNEIH